MKTNTLTPELLDTMDAYWRAANYLQLRKPTLTVPLSAPLSALPRHGQGPDRRSD